MLREEHVHVIANEFDFNIHSLLVFAILVKLLKRKKTYLLSLHMHIQSNLAEFGRILEQTQTLANTCLWSCVCTMKSALKFS